MEQLHMIMNIIILFHIHAQTDSLSVCLDIKFDITVHLSSCGLFVYTSIQMNALTFKDDRFNLLSGLIDSLHSFKCDIDVCSW